MITWEDFEKIELRVGTVVTAEEFSKARKPAYRLTIDFGPLGLKKSSAQITDHYSTADLVGKQVIAVTNFPPKQIADMMSECLVLGVVGDQSAVTLIAPDRRVENGCRIA